MRVKTGFTRHQNHKRLHKATQGFRMSKHKLVKVSREALIHAGQYAFNGRRKKKGNFRELWIERINAALKPFKLNYNKFIFEMAKANIQINRKMLAELAINDPATFSSIIEKIQVAK